MKKLLLIVAVLVSSLVMNLNAEIYGKQNYVSINPFSLLFNIFSGEYGRFLDTQGKTEVNIPVYFFNYDSFSGFGIGGKYRMYKDKNGEGIFYGGGLRFSSISWEYHFYEESNRKSDDISYIAFTPMGEAGYRWTWDNGWTISPSVELGYSISSFDDGDIKGGISADSDTESRLFYTINLGVSYMF
ncbi:MAG: hypothetical protein CR982_08060 [Candidatus Cloacimonadota bacterium]|nr:MAG: hypothetical protein CR982_08060 [Candidatus Cloacimonadota bacterium]PIE77632.1 MAG: hypothetical protein CSA15_11960 [Candidatus Delongbacteria bacterium]